MGGTSGSGSRLPEQSDCRIQQFAWTVEWEQSEVKGHRRQWSL